MDYVAGFARMSKVGSDKALTDRSIIIEPIQSRCSVFRFARLSEKDIRDRIRYIANRENVKLLDTGLDALIEASGGDLRKAINILQTSAAFKGGYVDEEVVLGVLGRVSPKEAKEILLLSLSGGFLEARETLRRLLLEQGLDQSIRCMNCEISCVFYHHKSLDLQKAHLHIHFAEETGEFEAVYCLQCEDPLCLASCPSEAIVKDQKTCWVTINPVRCIGCKNCTFCCPLSVPWFDERHQASMKCDFFNGEPRCAMVCSPKAIRVVTRKEAWRFNKETNEEATT